jgi:peptide deformylase
VLKVFNILCQEYPEMTMEAMAEMTSQAAGVGKAAGTESEKKRILTVTCHQVRKNFAKVIFNWKNTMISRNQQFGRKYKNYFFSQ